MKPRVGVLGGGAFGKAIATTAAGCGCETTLVSRVANDLRGVQVTRDAARLGDTDVVFVCVPSAVIEPAADELAGHLDGRHALVHVSRGLHGAGLSPLTDVLKQRTACRRVGVLAGPLVPEGLLDGRPGSAIVGTRFPEVTELVRDALAGEQLRVYDTLDVVGVEVASACVSVLSVAVGCARALELGPGALATVVTRGIFEAARIGEALGAERVTFGGLAGMGDLVAVVAGDERPELALARAIVGGEDPRSAITKLPSNTESSLLAPRLSSFGARRGLNLPIVNAVAAVLDGRVAAKAALRSLMQRSVGREQA